MSIKSWYGKCRGLRNFLSLVSQPDRGSDFPIRSRREMYDVNHGEVKSTTRPERHSLAHTHPPPSSVASDHPVAWLGFLREPSSNARSLLDLHVLPLSIAFDSTTYAVFHHFPTTFQASTFDRCGGSSPAIFEVSALHGSRAFSEPITNS
ncbi:hypothetical protein BT63DRAFT_124258 [Microthyrium microscopicum]|uniref:Uncharacterized protein n=1 Tax=Microthyrium microscopicum TaxID=703497 RepID=A0A6A6TV30_9PEZI|nr:hypothetical protein BT63DRAFT_124258 [Microthyrium microscopicum]